MAQKKAIFNNGQSGTLPAVSYVRDTAALDIEAGAYVPANTPYYSQARRRFPFPEWAEESAATHKWIVPVSGADRDGVTPLAANWDSGSRLLTIWRDKVPDGPSSTGGTPDVEIDIEHTDSQSVMLNGVGSSFFYDFFQGSRFQQDAVTYWPRAGICLPGCFVFECERNIETSPAVWESDGVGLVAMQRMLSPVIVNNPAADAVYEASGPSTGDPSVAGINCPAGSGLLVVITARDTVGVDYASEISWSGGGDPFETVLQQKTAVGANDSLLEVYYTAAPGASASGTVSITRDICDTVVVNVIVIENPNTTTKYSVLETGINSVATTDHRLTASSPPANSLVLYLGTCREAAPDVVTGVGGADEDVAHEFDASECITYLSSYNSPDEASKQMGFTNSIARTGCAAIIAIYGGSSTTTYKRFHIDDISDGSINLGVPRGNPWCFTSYFPHIAGQHPLLDAWLLPVDYQQQGGSGLGDGGQCGICRATRGAVDEDWQFGALLMLLEITGGGPSMHFHCAGWTPRGVLLSIGDSADKNEMVLFTCSDLDDYANADNWTTNRAVYGGVDQESNQWGGCAPLLADPNTLLVGGDAGPMSVYLVTVNADETVSIVPHFGYPTSATVSVPRLAFDALWYNKVSPERMAQSVTRAFESDADIMSNRVVYSNDVVAAAIARFPSVVGQTAYPQMLADGTVFIMNRDTSGIYSLTPPVLAAIRPLVVAPGGKNVLVLDGGELSTIVTQGTNTMALDSDPDAPGDGPVYNCIADGSDDEIASFRVVPAATLLPGTLWSCSFVKNNSNSKAIPIRWVHRDSASGANGQTGVITGIDPDTWSTIYHRLDGSGLVNPYLAQINMQVDSALLLLTDFFFQFQGWYNSEQMPYLVAPGDTGANMEVEQPLSAIAGADWTVGVELHIPEAGMDFAATDVTVALFTVWQDATNYIEVVYDAANNQVLATIINGGVEETNSPLVIADISIDRHDQVWAAVGSDGTNTHFWFVSGGYDENGLQTDSAVAAIAGVPASVRIGDNDFTQVPNVEVSMIAEDDETLLDAAGVQAMMETAGGGAANMLLMGVG